MKFKDLFDAIAFLKNQEWLKDERVKFHRDYNSGRGEVLIRIPNHDLAPSIKAVGGYYIFQLYEQKDRSYDIYINGRSLEKMVEHGDIDIYTPTDKDEEKTTNVRLPLFDDKGEIMAPEGWLVNRAISKAVSKLYPRAHWVPEGEILNIGHIFKIRDLVKQENPHTQLMQIDLDLTDYYKKFEQFFYDSEIKHSFKDKGVHVVVDLATWEQKLFVSCYCEELKIYFHVEQFGREIFTTKSELTDKASFDCIANTVTFTSDHNIEDSAELIQQIQVLLEKFPWSKEDNSKVMACF